MATSAVTDLKEELIAAGNRLNDPPSSLDVLLALLDEVEKCLTKVEQSPGESMQKALSPALQALVADKLFRHPELDVKVAVASCISEITRITAPEAPYDDDQMKEVFRLIVSSFGNLSDKSSRSYFKRTLILDTVAKVRSCVVMLDLECDELIVEMFQTFLRTIRDHHPENVFSSMEIIMSLVLEESEEITTELLSPILDSLKNNEEVLPIARKLGEKVLENSSCKVKPYLKQTVRTLGISLDDYSKVVSSICEEMPRDDTNAPNDADEQMQTQAVEGEIVKTSSDDAKQLNEGTETEVPSTEQDDHEDDMPLKPSEDSGIPQAEEDESLVVSDKPEKEDGHEDDMPSKPSEDKGVPQAEEDESLVVSDKPEKEEDAHPTDQIETTNESTSEGHDSLETEKAVTTVHNLGQASKRKGRKPNSSFKLVETSDTSDTSQNAGSDKETEVLPDPESQKIDNSCEPSEDPSVEPDLSLENRKEAKVLVSPSKVLESELTNAVSPTPSGSLDDETHKSKGKVVEEEHAKATSPLHSVALDDESHSLKSKKFEKKEETIPLADYAPEKASEETSDTANKPYRLIRTKVRAGVKEDDLTSVLGSSEEASGSLADEGRSRKKKRSDRKQESIPSADDGPEKASEEASDSLADESHYRRKKKPAKREESMPLVDDAPEKASEEASGIVADESRSRKKKRSEKRGVSKRAADDVSEKAPEEGSASPVDEIRSKNKKSEKKEESVPAVDDAPEKASEEASDMDDEPHRPIQKKVRSGGKASETRSVLDSSKKKTGTMKVAEAKPLKHETKKPDAPDKVKGRPSSIKTEKNKGRTQAALEKSVAKDDEVSSPEPTEHHFRESPKTVSKRKRTPGKEKESGNSPDDLIGKKVKVWWPLDKKYYEGVIESLDFPTKKHKVTYADGDVEWLYLKKEKWEIITDSAQSDEEQGSDHPSPDASFDIPLKKKMKTKSGQSSKQVKPDSSQKGVGSAPSSKSKKAETKSSNVKSKDFSKSESKANSKSKKLSKSANESDSDDDDRKSSKSKKDERITPKSSKSKEETTLKLKISNPKPETPKSKGKLVKNVNKSNSNGTGKMKSGSSKVKKVEDIKEDSTDVEMDVASPKGKSTSASKVSGKRRRG